MILNSNTNRLLEDPPFFATVRSELGVILTGSDVQESEGSKVSFNKGKVFHCYDSNTKAKQFNKQKFSRGASWHYPTNIGERFDYKIGDKFYLRPDRSGKKSQIVRVGEDTNAPQDGDILIWECFQRGDNYGSTQYLSQNVFLQNTEEFRQLALTSFLIEEKDNNEKCYRMNGGFVCIFNQGITEYIDTFEYTLKPNEQRFYYIQLDVTITEESEEDQVREANRKYIKDFKVEKIQVIHRSEEITDEEKANNQAYIGEECAKRVGDEFQANRKQGKYWVALPAHGNINLNVNVFNVDPVILKAEIIDAFFDQLNTSLDRPRGKLIKLLYAANRRSFETNCDLPNPLPIAEDFFNDPDIFELRSAIPYNGDGTYGPKLISIPDDFDIEYSIRGGELNIPSTTADACEYFAEFGEFPTKDIATRMKAKTSFIDIEEI